METLFICFTSLRWRVWTPCRDGQGFFAWKITHLLEVDHYYHFLADLKLQRFSDMHRDASRCIEGSPFHLGYHEHVPMLSQLSPHFAAIPWVHLFSWWQVRDIYQFVHFDGIHGWNLATCHQGGMLQCFFFEIFHKVRAISCGCLLSLSISVNINEHMINVNNSWKGWMCIRIRVL